MLVKLLEATAIAEQLPFMSGIRTLLADHLYGANVNPVGVDQQCSGEFLKRVRHWWPS